MTERQRKFGIVACCVVMLTLGLFSQCGVYAQPPAKVDQVKLREQLRALIKEQGQLLEGAQKRLVESVSTSSALFDQLAAAQTQMDKIGQERDGWKASYERDHEKLLKSQSKILKLGIVIGLMTLAIGAYLVAKFYFRLPI